MPPSEEPSETGEDLPLDVVFDMLSNERRRRVLRYLLAHTQDSTLGDIAEHIAAIENDKPEGALTSTERKRVYICLYQCHLPKLDDAGVIEFDEHRKTVTVGPAIDSLTPYLPDEEPTTVTDPWPRYALGFTLVAAGAIALQGLLFPAAWLSGVLIGVLLAVITLAAFDRLRRYGRLPWGVDLPFVPTSPSAVDR